MCRASSHFVASYTLDACFCQTILLTLSDATIFTLGHQQLPAGLTLAKHVVKISATAGARGLDVRVRAAAAWPREVIRAETLQQHGYPDDDTVLVKSQLTAGASTSHEHPGQEGPT